MSKRLMTPEFEIMWNLNLCLLLVTGGLLNVLDLNYVLSFSVNSHCLNINNENLIQANWMPVKDSVLWM